jgi:hypothetical protein
MAPEAFSGPEIAAANAVKLEAITDPKTRALAERGKYIVVRDRLRRLSCAAERGRSRFRQIHGRRTEERRQRARHVRERKPHRRPRVRARQANDEDVLRVLRSGVSADGGRLFWYRAMPWAWFANWTEEDRVAVLTYLRQIPAIAHKIPPATARRR